MLDPREHILLPNNQGQRDLLDPIDLIRLVHVSRATRRTVAPALNRLEADAAQTRAHSEMFRGFLRQPRITEGNQVWNELTEPKEDKAALAGPLRLGTIKDRAADLEKRFVILTYKKSYDFEQSMVALFDDKGAFLAYYEFISKQFYEDYCTKDSMGTGRRCYDSDGVPNASMPQIIMVSSGWAPWASDYCDESDGEGVKSEGEDVIKWRPAECAQTDYYRQEGWLGDVTFPHFTLIDSLAGVISPTEAMFVLMHALSSDTRVIYVCTLGFFDAFALDLENNRREAKGSRGHSQEEWANKLGGFSY